MQIIQPNQTFGFNYTAYDQSATLKVGFNIYDASGSGAPVFIEQVAAQYAGFGSYTGTYFAEAGLRYVVIGIVYTDVGLTIVDTTRAPSSDVYRTDADSITNLGFVYTTYDFATGLFIKAQIYNTTTGSPVLQTSTNLNYIAFGVYFGSFEGDLTKNYQIIGVVYTDGTYTVVNYNYAPSSISFMVIGSTPDPLPTTSTLIDVSALMYDPDFVYPMSLITRLPTVNTHGENVITETTINSFGSIQPASGKTLARLPEALRNADISSFWFRGVIVATEPTKYPSILVFQGRRFQVKNVMDWSFWGRGWTEGLCVAELPA